VDRVRVEMGCWDRISDPRGATRKSRQHSPLCQHPHCVSIQSVQTFCTSSRRPAGPHAPPNTAASPGPPLELHAGRAQRRSAGAKLAADRPGRGSAPGVQDHGGFDKEPSRRLVSGWSGHARRQPDRGQAYEPPPLIKSTVPQVKGGDLTPDWCLRCHNLREKYCSHTVIFHSRERLRDSVLQALPQQDLNLQSDIE
jgi:hypothetical protein